MKRKIHILLVLLWGISSIISPLFCVPTAEISDSLPEIIVSDTRINTLEQHNIPSNQVFLSQIENERLQSLKDFSAFVSNLYIPDYGSKMTSSVYVRGLGARIDNPVIGVYIDGFAIANKNNYDFRLFDIQSLKTYRGPQGTLFGRNTICGISSIKTLSPLSYSGTRAEIGYANHNTAEVKASHYHNQAIRSGLFGIAAAAAYKHTDGFFVNSFDNSKADQTDEASARLKAEWQLQNGTDIMSLTQYNYTNQTGFPYHQIAEPINHNDYCGYFRHNLLQGISLSKTIGGIRLSSATSYQYLFDEMQMDNDYTPLSYFTLVQQQSEHHIAEELTLKPQQAYIFGNQYTWDWISGATLSYRHNATSAPVHFLSDGIDSLILKNANSLSTSAAIEIQENDFVIYSDFITQNANIALYHTSYLNLKDWQIEMGLRLDYEYQHFNYDSHATIHSRISPTSAIITTPYKTINSKVEGQTSQQYIEVLPKLSISYIRPTWQLYASASEGYKAGGFNTQLFSDILQNELKKDMTGSKTGPYSVSNIISYSPERCISFEIGSKLNKRLGDCSLRANISAYEMEIFNQQLTIFPENSTGRMMTNAGRSRSMGAELFGQLQYKGLTVRLSYGYTYAYFVDYNDNQHSYNGNIVPYAPSNTLAAGADYKFNFNNKWVHSLDIDINSTGVGRIYWNEKNTLSQPFYALLNANINLQLKWLSIGIWGKNLTNTQYDSFYFESMNRQYVQSGKTISFGGKISLEI